MKLEKAVVLSTHKGGDIVLIDKILNALDQGKCVVGLFLDFSKAFDTVNHNIRLNKLKHYSTLNVDKTNFIVFSKRRTINDVYIKIKGKNIERVN